MNFFRPRSQSTDYKTFNFTNKSLTKINMNNFDSKFGNLHKYIILIIDRLSKELVLGNDNHMKKGADNRNLLNKITSRVSAASTRNKMTSIYNEIYDKKATETNYKTQKSNFSLLDNYRTANLTNLTSNLGKSKNTYFNKSSLNIKTNNNNFMDNNKANKYKNELFNWLNSGPQNDKAKSIKINTFANPSKIHSMKQELNSLINSNNNKVNTNMRNININYEFYDISKVKQKNLLASRLKLNTPKNNFMTTTTKTSNLIGGSEDSFYSRNISKDNSRIMSSTPTMKYRSKSQINYLQNLNKSNLTKKLELLGIGYNY